MKKTLISLFCAAICCSCKAQHSLTVKTDGIKIDKLEIVVTNKEMNAPEKREELITKDGDYTYDFNGDKARMAFLNITRDNAQAHLNIFLVPGEQGILTCSANGATWSGSQFYNDLGKIEQTTDSLKDELSYAMSEAQRQMEEGADMDSLKTAMMPRLQSIKQQSNNALLNFIKTNPDNNTSASLLPELDNPENGIEMLSDAVKNGVFSDFIEVFQARIAKKKEKEQKTNNN